MRRNKIVYFHTLMYQFLWGLWSIFFTTCLACRLTPSHLFSRWFRQPSGYPRMLLLKKSFHQVASLCNILCWFQIIAKLKSGGDVPAEEEV